MRPILLLIGMALAFPAAAQELLFHAGITHSREERQTTYAWSVGYDQALGEHTFFTLGWINEGHLDSHHRDGPVAQIGARARLMDRRLGLSIAAGPYAYFDTTLAGQGASYADDHGFGIVYGASLSWYCDSPWFLQLRARRIQSDSDIDTSRLLLGVGYEFAAEREGGDATPRAARTTGNEITVFAGLTILNSFESQDSFASAIEYRRGVARHVDWTLGWLHEGDNQIIRRNGATTQLWAVRAFLDERLTLGAGAGAYVVVDERRGDDTAANDGEPVSGIVSLTASYRFGRRWLARFTWNRIVTGYSRDTDVILLGSGHRF